jgi:hypothetical protein
MTKGSFVIISGIGDIDDQNDRKFKEELQDYIKSTWPNAKVTDDEKTLERFVVHIE